MTKTDLRLHGPTPRRRGSRTALPAALAFALAFPLASPAAAQVPNPGGAPATQPGFLQGFGGGGGAQAGLGAPPGGQAPLNQAPQGQAQPRLPGLGFQQGVQVQPGQGLAQPTVPGLGPAIGSQSFAPQDTDVLTPAARVYQRNQQSVVNINSLSVARVLGLGVVEEEGGVGSGFVLDREGHIVTNNHVIEDADELTVTFPLPAGGQVVVPAEVVGTDPITDLAVIKVDPNFATDQGAPLSQFIEPVTLGRLQDVFIGQPAIAMGAPLGLTQTVTQGIVSAIRGPGDEAAVGLDLVSGAIQTDAPINPGNSGGPLFNAAGEVIGVNNAILSQSGGNIGIGFAIPINAVRRVVPLLIERGCYPHPLIGVTTLPLGQLGQETKRRLGFDQRQKGLLVQSVSAGAAEAGLQAGNRTVTIGGERIRVGGDIVVGVAGRTINSAGDLRGYIENNLLPGDQVTLTVLRNGQLREVTVTLSARNPECV